MLNLRIVSSVFNLLSLVIHAGLLAVLLRKLFQKTQGKSQGLSSSVSLPMKLMSKFRSAPALFKTQIFVVAALCIHTPMLIAADWTDNSATQCDGLRRTVTTSKIGIMLLFNVFLYLKAYTVSFEMEEKCKTQTLLKYVLFGFGTSMAVAPFVSSGTMVRINATEVYCTYNVWWIFCLLGFGSFMFTTFLFTLLFIQPVLSTFKNQTNSSDKGTMTAGGGGSSSDVVEMDSAGAATTSTEVARGKTVASNLPINVRKVIWVNFVSCVLMNFGMTMFMLYMTLVMYFNHGPVNSSLRFFVGSVSSLEAIISTLSMLFCTMQKNLCADWCFRLTNDVSPGTVLTPADNNSAQT